MISPRRRGKEERKDVETKESYSLVTSHLAVLISSSIVNVLNSFVVSISFETQKKLKMRDEAKEWESIEANELFMLPLRECMNHSITIKIYDILILPDHRRHSYFILLTHWCSQLRINFEILFLSIKEFRETSMGTRGFKQWERKSV